MIGSTSTLGSTLTRVALTSVVATAAMFMAVAAVGAGNPVGFLLALPGLYLVWVWLIDLIALVSHRFRASDVYVRRPYYWMWLASCAVPVLAWMVWLSSRQQG
jgi:hypothetical protein